MQEISKKIIAQKIEITAAQNTSAIQPTIAAKVEMVKVAKHTPRQKRPKRLDNTWRIKPPGAKRSMYVTLVSINADGKKYPYEIFFNSKDPSHVVWTNALTLSISMVFKLAIEHSFTLDTFINGLKDIFDSTSGYFTKITTSGESRYVNSIVAEIGLIIEAYILEVNQWNTLNGSGGHLEQASCVDDIDTHPESDTRLADPSLLCPDCHSRLIKEAGCDKCIVCSYSKCG